MSLYFNTVELKNYVKSMDDTLMVVPTERLQEMVVELRSNVKKPTFNKAYCELKLRVIRTISTKLQQVTANRR
jgi:hypothetical protein